MIKCACGEPECKTKIHFDWCSKGLWFTDKTGKETPMYLDANAIVDLIKELREGLMEITNEPET